MINFFKKNWALIILIIIALLWVKDNYLPNSLSTASFSSTSGDFSSLSSLNSVSLKSTAAPSESTTRIILQNTGLSLQVRDVSDTINKIEETTRNLGGFLIKSTLSKPESAASGNISVRVPEEKRKEAMEAFKKMAVKVVSESIEGTDVTDQYTDLESRLAVLDKTKIKYENIMQKAETVTEILSVQQQLTSLQTQIDNLKGQQQYYEQSAKLSKITIYLSTDELSLPYSPTNEWRPAVIFKDAVRSLISTFRGIGSLIIWGVVFIPIIIPLILIIWLIRRKIHQKNVLK